MILRPSACSITSIFCCFNSWDDSECTYVQSSIMFGIWVHLQHKKCFSPLERCMVPEDSGSRDFPPLLWAQVGPVLQDHSLCLIPAVHAACCASGGVGGGVLLAAFHVAGIPASVLPITESLLQVFCLVQAFPGFSSTLVTTSYNVNRAELFLFPPIPFAGSISASAGHLDNSSHVTAHWGHSDQSLHSCLCTCV